MQHQSHTQKMLRNILRCIEANESIRQHPLRDTVAKLPASQNILWIFPATSFPTQYSRLFCYNSMYVCVIDAVPRVSFLPLVVGRIYHHLVLFLFRLPGCVSHSKNVTQSPPSPSNNALFTLPTIQRWRWWRNVSPLFRSSSCGRVLVTPAGL